jgi:hypothetical protein
MRVNTSDASADSVLYIEIPHTRGRSESTVERALSSSGKPENATERERCPLSRNARDSTASE